MFSVRGGRCSVIAGPNVLFMNCGGEGLAALPFAHGVVGRGVPSAPPPTGPDKDPDEDADVAAAVRRWRRRGKDEHARGVWVKFAAARDSPPYLLLKGW